MLIFSRLPFRQAAKWQTHLRNPDDENHTALRNPPPVEWSDFDRSCTGMRAVFVTAVPSWEFVSAKPGEFP
jgi:hypothetical protein